MNHLHDTTTDQLTPHRYEIRLKGQLGKQWAGVFNGVTQVHTGDNETRLTCLVVDQAALHGLLRKIRDLGLELIAVNRIDTD